MFELLKQADSVLDSCGRRVPPVGYQYVDLPGCISIAAISSSSVAVTRRVSNSSKTQFVVMGIGALPGPGRYRVRWPNGRFWQQNPTFNPAIFSNSPTGVGNVMYALENPVVIDPGAVIAVEISGPNAVDPGRADLQCWGVYRWMLEAAAGGSLDSASLAGKASGVSCLVGYAAKTGGAAAGGPVGFAPGSGVNFVPNPIEELRDLARYKSGPSQNIMAPEWFLTSQEITTPAGFVDEAYTFFSDAITVPLGSSSYGNAVIVPGGGADVLIRRFRAAWFYDNGGTNPGPVYPPTPIVGMRLPNGYSITGADLVPCMAFGWVPLFPPPTIASGGRIILDLSSIAPQGFGTVTEITQTFEFDGVKRRKL